LTSEVLVFLENKKISEKLFLLIFIGKASSPFLTNILGFEVVVGQ
jgi:hypothetical protein